MCIEGLAPKYLAEVMWMVSKMELVGHKAAHWSLVLKIDTTNCEKLLFRLISTIDFHCKFVGIGMVQAYVMNEKEFQRRKQHG
jgi:hypothetical protein